MEKINMNNGEQFPEHRVHGVQTHMFTPYESNGGSIVGIAGNGYVVIATDTRLSSGYSVHTREQSKLFQLTSQTILASAGCWCDTISLVSLMKIRIQMYHHIHQKVMSTKALAQMLSIMMYNKRFFPYYVSNIIAGLDEAGNGVVYSYDPIGHCEKSMYKAGGTAGPLIQPLLDSLIGLKNLNTTKKPNITKEQATIVAIDSFISAAERDIYTGDAAIVNVITPKGIEVKNIPLRND